MDVSKGAHDRPIRAPKVPIRTSGTEYHDLLRAGEPSALKTLKPWQESPDRPEPLAAMADCYYNFQEYEESAEYFIKAARLADGDDKAEHLAFAAKALRKAKKPREALQLLLEEFRTKGLHAASDRRLRKEVYAILKDTRNLPAAFAVGEWTDGDIPLIRVSIHPVCVARMGLTTSCLVPGSALRAAAQLDGVFDNIGLPIRC